MGKKLLGNQIDNEKKEFEFRACECYMKVSWFQFWYMKAKLCIGWERGDIENNNNIDEWPWSNNWIKENW